MQVRVNKKHCAMHRCASHKPRLAARSREPHTPTDAATMVWARLARNRTGFRSKYQAERACHRSHNCSAVYDPSCDGKGMYYTCNQGFAFARSSRSCVYTRVVSGAPTSCLSRGPSCW